MNLKDWVLERHDHWWRYLLDRVGGCLLGSRDKPTVDFYSRAGSTAGRGSKNRCRYNLAFVATISRKEFDWVVCHECCHAFAKRLMPDSSSHGELWLWLYRDVCESQRNKYHNYDVGVASKAAPGLRKLLRLAKKMKGLRQ